MPLYDHRCACGRVFEVKASMKDEPRSEPCPSCDQPAPRVILSIGGVVFKGSGFYETDYKKRNPERHLVIERF